METLNMERGYLPIEDYGLIGNLHTTALVSKQGSIDYMPYDRFDSPTVFAALLDRENGGFFSINKPTSRTQPSS
jgi:GH15 family glucan-1,4-alpha-glucosidase